MDALPRHQCLIYEGSPSKQLKGLATFIASKLNANYRCLYLNSPPMVAGIRSYLAAAGLDVAAQVDQRALILSSEQKHLIHGNFDVASMLAMLEEAVNQALNDGYAGLWATGDMGWEFGDEKNFEKLLEYEYGLEQIFRKFPQLSGVCQYRQDALPIDAVRTGFYAHQAVFVNETLSRLNPHYAAPQLVARKAPEVAAAQLQQMLDG